MSPPRGAQYGTATTNRASDSCVTGRISPSAMRAIQTLAWPPLSERKATSVSSGLTVSV